MARASPPTDTAANDPARAAPSLPPQSVPEQVMRWLGWTLIFTSVFFTGGGESRFWLLMGIGALMVYEPDPGAGLCNLVALAVLGIARPYNLLSGHSSPGGLVDLQWLAAALFVCGLVYACVTRMRHSSGRKGASWIPQWRLADGLLLITTVTIGMWWARSPEIRLDLFRELGMTRRIADFIDDHPAYDRLLIHMPEGHRGAAWVRRLRTHWAHEFPVRSRTLELLRVAYEMRASTHEEALTTLRAVADEHGVHEAMALFALTFEPVDAGMRPWYKAIVTTPGGLPVLLPPTSLPVNPGRSWFPAITERWRLGAQERSVLPDDPWAELDALFASPDWPALAGIVSDADESNLGTGDESPLDHVQIFSRMQVLMMLQEVDSVATEAESRRTRSAYRWDADALRYVLRAP